MRRRFTEAAVDAVFEAAKDQTDYLIGLYKLVLPEWDDIDHLEGWPQINDYTWKAIAHKAMAWDEKHVDSLSGGAWMNSGFSGNGNGLPNWTAEVDMERVVLKYKAPVLAAI